MSEFLTYFQVGLEHILDINGIDHILFVIALTIVYDHNQSKNLLVLITAFTLGHSVTLALSALNFVEVDSRLIETLIPVTILITAASNIVFYLKEKPKGVKINYFFASFFGLIHGLGF